MISISGGSQLLKSETLNIVIPMLFHIAESFYYIEISGCISNTDIKDWQILFLYNNWLRSLFSS